MFKYKSTGITAVKASTYTSTRDKIYQMYRAAARLQQIYPGSQEDPGTYRVIHSDKPQKDIAESLTRKTRSRLEPPTCQLAPTCAGRVDRREVERCMRRVIYKHLAIVSDDDYEEYGDGEERKVKMLYEPQSAGYNTKLITENIKKKIKELNHDRYKCIVMVWIGQLLGQGLHIGTRSLWDVTTDQAVSVTVKTSEMYCTACVYFIYQH